MSLLSVSDTLLVSPVVQAGSTGFDVVWIADEASQIPLEEAIPALYRALKSSWSATRCNCRRMIFFSSSAKDVMRKSLARRAWIWTALVSN